MANPLFRNVFGCNRSIERFESLFTAFEPVKIIDVRIIEDHKPFTANNSAIDNAAQLWVTVRPHFAVGGKALGYVHDGRSFRLV
ncbi:hypothetical protein D3C71_1394770 [compost metagenome]